MTGPRSFRLPPSARPWLAWLAAVSVLVASATASAEAIEPEPEPPATTEPDPESPESPEGAESTPEPNPEQQQQIDQLQQRIDTLERQVEVLRESQAEVAKELGKPPPVIVTPEPKAPPSAPSAPADVEHNRSPDYADGFHFGSYGRVVMGGDHRGRRGRDGDIVARGTRLDESTYAELELRREDYWEQTGSFTRVVATVAIAAPLFHQTGTFDTTMGVRNLYIEESGLGLKNLRLWAGSRMYRGDDIYLLDFWPLDNLNTLGGGAAYNFRRDTELRLQNASLRRTDQEHTHKDLVRCAGAQRKYCEGLR